MIHDNRDTCKICGKSYLKTELSWRMNLCKTCRLKVFISLPNTKLPPKPKSISKTSIKSSFKTKNNPFIKYNTCKFCGKFCKSGELYKRELCKVCCNKRIAIFNFILISTKIEESYNFVEPTKKVKILFNLILASTLKTSIDEYLEERAKINLKARKYRASRPKKNYSRINKLKSCGVTEEWYNETMKKQDNKCFICGSPDRLCIDHDHSTGKARGILCNNCNSAIGFFRDNPKFMKNGINYLKKSDFVTT